MWQVHIQFYQRPGQTNFTIQTTPWNAKGLYSTGWVRSDSTATWLMVGAPAPSTYQVYASKLSPGAPPCTMLSSGWCKFPFCGRLPVGSKTQRDRPRPDITHFLS